ncbi:hypothetical protein BD560DRAFT_393602 [Blakeslea trispora]|nr:hypothetical protein BD560DRAFT_393602 [Blakeslea trispora]
MEDLCRHFKTKVFGKPARLSSTLKVEVLDLLSDFNDDRDSKKLKSSLAQIAGREDGAIYKVKTSRELDDAGEQGHQDEEGCWRKKAENILEAVGSCLFKITDGHNLYG